jgi:hypothetical protein
MTNRGVSLIVIFNHRYEQNIPKLHAYYSPRFSKIKYIVPFVPEPHTPDTIRVVENGFTFSGHIAQGARDFIEEDVSCYAFIADDLILNPRLNEDNFESALGVDSTTGYIKSLAALDSLRYSWHSAANAAVDLLRAAFDYKSELPPTKEARERFERMGFRFGVGKPSLANIMWCLKRAKSVPFWFMRLISMARRESDYPLLAGYSDFVTVPSTCIDKFVHYCGVFSAMNMFAEVAVPTALALAVDDVRTELVRGDHFASPNARRNPDVKMQGLEIWEGKSSEFAQQLGYNFSRLIDEFPHDRLYVHPVKLSKWN